MTSLVPISSKCKYVDEYLYMQSGKRVSFQTPHLLAPFGFEQKFQPRINLSLDLERPGTSDFIAFVRRHEAIIAEVEELGSYRLNSVIVKRSSFPDMLKVGVRRVRKVPTLACLRQGKDVMLSAIDFSKPIELSCHIATLWVNHSAREYGLSLLADSLTQNC